MVVFDASWRPTRNEAIAVQRSLSAAVEIRPLSRQPRTIAGADVAYSRNGQACFASMVVSDAITDQVLDQSVVKDSVPYPYVSGLLAFREVLPLVHAFCRLRVVPELVLVDGHGTLHPRGVGLASHLGILLDLPTIGCAKGPPLRPEGFGHLPRGNRGSCHALSAGSDRTRGVLLHTKALHKPLCISPGHKITLEESIQWALRLTGRFRVPEPIRRAHHLATKARLTAEGPSRDQGSRIRGQGSGVGDREGGKGSLKKQGVRS